MHHCARLKRAGRPAGTRVRQEWLLSPLQAALRQAQLEARNSLVFGERIKTTHGPATCILAHLLLKIGVQRGGPTAKLRAMMLRPQQKGWQTR